MNIREVLKQAIIDELRLADTSPQDIQDDAPLFGAGLNLDSLDAIELVVLVQRHFGVDMEDKEEAKQAFASINALVDYIEKHQERPCPPRPE